MGEVMVKVEAFGERPLVRVFEASELKGKTFKHILEKMVQENWEGKDLVVSEGINSEMHAHGGYAISQKLGGGNLPVKYESIPVDDQVRIYEKNTTDENMPVISIAVCGSHDVGRKYDI